MLCKGVAHSALQQSVSSPELHEAVHQQQREVVTRHVLRLRQHRYRYRYYRYYRYRYAV